MLTNILHYHKKYNAEATVRKYAVSIGRKRKLGHWTAVSAALFILLELHCFCINHNSFC